MLDATIAQPSDENRIYIQSGFIGNIKSTKSFNENGFFHIIPSKCYF